MRAPIGYHRHTRRGGNTGGGVERDWVSMVMMNIRGGVGDDYQGYRLGKWLWGKLRSGSKPEINQGVIIIL